MQTIYPDYDTLVQEYQEGNISSVEFVMQQSDEMTQEYKHYCVEKKIDPNSEGAAIAFMEFREQLFEESMSE